MYRVLIVDDEKIERQGIRFLLGQMKEPFEVEEAVNGRDALEWLQTHEVDILMTDVKMPFMNGLELLGHVSKQFPQMKKIVFSGYGEFEYARQAMRYGVAEYILKPVNPTEFKESMEKILKSLEGRRAEQKQKERSITFFKEYVLNAVLNGMDLNELKKMTEQDYSLDFLDGYRRMMLVELNGDFFGKRAEADVLDILESQGVEFDYLNLSPQQSILFFTQQYQNWKEIARKICSAIQQNCENGLKCYVAVSSGIHERNHLASRYQELEFLMENRFYDLESNVYMAENEAENAEDVRLDDDTLIRQMKQDIRAKDILSLREHCDRLFHNYSKNIGFSQVYVKFMLSSLLKLLYEALPEKTDKELNAEMDRLYRTADLSSIRTIIEDNIDLLEKNLQKDAGSVHREVETVKRYIYAHYGEELSIEMLAEQVYLAPSYLSTIFKKETGQNLSKFIKACRMEKARDMLENTYEKIVQISEKVGYPNVSYFCQSFREYFGVSPQKYRDKGESYEENTELD
ncbi:MAG: response regulator [Lachnospiraceae bacterium]|nr:response regulator [Lachnospiraceae bacterium]